MLAHFGQGCDQPGVPRDEGRPVSGQVRLLRQGVQAQQPRVAAAVDPLVEERGRLGNAPGQLRVAFVGCEDRAAIARPGDDPAQLGEVEDVPVGVAGRIQPYQRDVCGPGGGIRGRVERKGRCPGQSGPDVVGRVGDPREGDDVALAQPEEGGKEGHRLLRADGGEHAEAVAGGRAPAPGAPVVYRFAQGGRADRRRVARRVRSRAQGVADAAGHGVDRCADGQVHRAVRVPCGALADRDEGIPREVGEGPAVQRHGGAYS